MRIIVGCLLLLFASTSCAMDDGGDDLAANEARMSRSEYGKDWPLTVEAGVVRCEGAGAVTFTTGGTTYAVNGLARGMGTYPDVHAIWADDPDFEGLKKYIGPIIDRGLALCN